MLWPHVTYIALSEGTRNVMTASVTTMQSSIEGDKIAFTNVKGHTGMRNRILHSAT